MPDPTTIEDVQREYEEHPYATPSEHVSNLIEESEKSESEEEE